MINSLATQGGLLRISELVDFDLRDVAEAERCTTFEDLCWPLLLVITHKDALSSLILEKAIGDIYAFLHGIQGRRGSKAFLSFASALQAKSKIPQEADANVALFSWATAILAALAKLLECNQTASIHGNLHPVVDSIQSCLEADCPSFKGTLLEQAASQYMLKVRRHLDYGTNIAALPERHSAVTLPTAGFDLAMEGPGHLSTAGQRHDNDHADIKDVRILPSAQEIYSPRAEYLPTRDSSNWHVAGIRGLIDNQFRLLREDTVGQLRDCVRTVMDDFHASRSDKPGKSARSQGMRIYKYSGVTLSDLIYDKRKRRLLVMAHFHQPDILARRSSLERQRWWKDSRQLQVDSLVCLVDSEGNNLFFCVAERDGFQALQTMGEDDEELAAPQSTQNLWKEPTEATITLKLIDLENQTVAPMLGRDLQNTKVKQVLVEFPGVLLPSFQPTLEALQRMSIHGDVPFSATLVPNSGVLPHADRLSCPRYALQPRFAFDLSPILSDGDPLYLKRSEDFNIAALRERSTLDEAQCRALIGALSRELALVQGPPGTGKSFVAIQAIKILLKHRIQAEMNPIICV